MRKNLLDFTAGQVAAHASCLTSEKIGFEDDTHGTNTEVLAYWHLRYVAGDVVLSGNRQFEIP